MRRIILELEFFMSLIGVAVLRVMSFLINSFVVGRVAALLR